MSCTGVSALPPADGKKQFCLRDGKIIYQVQVREGQSCKRDGKNEWFGCNFCDRWLQSISQLECHYAREHEEAETYQFELLELKNCTIKLPYVLSTIRLSTHEKDSNKLHLQLSALTLSTENHGGSAKVPTSMKRAIRKAIKATQINRNGSSYRKIKAHLVTKTGMDAKKIERNLRKILERYVEFNKLERHYKKGKTLYCLPSHKRTREARKMPRQETRRFRDQQLKLLAKSLRPHDLLPHE